MLDFHGRLSRQTMRLAVTSWGAPHLSNICLAAARAVSVQFAVTCWRLTWPWLCPPENASTPERSRPERSLRDEGGGGGCEEPIWATAAVVQARAVRRIVEVFMARMVTHGTSTKNG